MTAIGTVALQLAGAGNAAAAQAGGRTVLNNKLSTLQQARGDWSGVAATHLYGWYYDTQAVFHLTHGQGRDWAPWSELFQLVLIENQHPDGYWTHGERHGMGGDQLMGKILSTTFSCLQLEVFYRHLASFHLGNQPTRSPLNLLDAGKNPLEIR